MGFTARESVLVPEIKNRMGTMQGKNTHYFHAKATAKRRAIQIEGLKLENGEWQFEEGKLREYVVNHFNKFYEGHRLIAWPRLHNGYPKLDSSLLPKLTITTKEEEIRHAIKMTKPFKALGPDGFQTVFYQS